MSSSLVVCIFGALLCGISLMTAAEKFTHQYVFEWTKVLTNQEIYAMLAQKEIQWPVHDSIPPPSFSCPQKQYPGFYAGKCLSQLKKYHCCDVFQSFTDPATQCQTFHRCDINGNLTSYICVNTTVFNPITLVCDHWFNVDCDRYGTLFQTPTSKCAMLNISPLAANVLKHVCVTLRVTV